MYIVTKKHPVRYDILFRLKCGYALRRYRPNDPIFTTIYTRSNTIVNVSKLRDWRGRRFCGFRTVVYTTSFYPSYVLVFSNFFTFYVALHARVPGRVGKTFDANGLGHDIIFMTVFELR